MLRAPHHRCYTYVLWIVDCVVYAICSTINNICVICILYNDENNEKLVSLCNEQHTMLMHCTVNCVVTRRYSSDVLLVAYSFSYLLHDGYMFFTFITKKINFALITHHLYA